jgi:hypothetical protein
MTSFADSIPRARHRAQPRAAALLVAALAALAALAIGTGWSSTGAAAGADRRIALVVDAGARPGVALERARDAATSSGRAGGQTVAVRLPRTAAEAATDVRYLAAHGSDSVVAVGPLSRRAALDSGVTARGTRIVTPATIPRTLR